MSPTVTPFLGMRGTSDFTTDQRPEHWRGMIMRLFPNGRAPLTALTTMMGQSKATDAHFHWFQKNLPSQNADLVNSGVYTTAALSTAYTSGGSDGDTVYAKIAAADLPNFRVGHWVMLRKATDVRGDTRAEVTDKGSNYLELLLLEDANATIDLDVATIVSVKGNVNAEGSNRPDAIVYKPQERENFTEIFRNALDITRTAKETELRTGDPYQEDKRDALELHGVELEKGLLWGKKKLTTGSNGKPKRYTDGLITVIRSLVTANVSDFRFDSDFSGKTWQESGKAWIDTMMEVIFRYGDREKFALVGSVTLQAISDLAMLYGDVNITVETTEFGMQILRWKSASGTLVMKDHPLFVDTDADRRSMVIFEPRHLEYKYITDTKFIADTAKGGGDIGKDATAEEYLTECGLQYDFVEGFGYLTGFGYDNAG